MEEKKPELRLEQKQKQAQMLKTQQETEMYKYEYMIDGLKNNINEIIEAQHAKRKASNTTEEMRKELKRLKDPLYDPYVERKTKERHGRTNIKDISKSDHPIMGVY